MDDVLTLAGDIDAVLPGCAAALADLRGRILVTAGDAQIPAAENFMGPGLIVLTLPPAQPDSWQAARQAAELWAFTRFAALRWAPRGVRVNAISLGRAALLPDQPAPPAAHPGTHAPAAPATPDDVAATIALLWSAKSITGQLVRLGA